MLTALSVLLLAGVILAVAWPLLRPAIEPLVSDRGPASHLATLEERKHAIYGAIRDLGLDLRTDKVSEADYQKEVDALKAEAVGVLAEIDRLRGEPPRGSAELEERIRLARAGATADDGAVRFCTRCGRPAASADLFCGGCGNSLGRA